MDSFLWARDLPDNDWLLWLAGEYSSAAAVSSNGMLPPPMPEKGLQATFVGQSGVRALTEANIFLNHIVKEANLPSEPRVLDFACGWGRLYRIMLRQTWELTGADSEPTMVDTCKATLPGRFELINNAPPYPFKEEEFDLIYAFSLFSHLAEHVAIDIFREFSRILKPGGYVAITLLEENTAKIRWMNTLEDFDEDKWNFNTKSGEVMFLPIGGGYESMSEDRYGWTFISKSALKRILESLPFEIGERVTLDGITQEVLLLKRI